MMSLQYSILIKIPLCNEKQHTVLKTISTEKSESYKTFLGATGETERVRNLKAVEMEKEAQNERNSKQLPHTWPETN